MAAIFETFGPFELARRGGLDSESLEDFWGQEGVPSGLRDECGIYIVCTRHGSSPLKPWYVGKTEGRFEKRFNSHLKSRKFDEIAKNSPNGPLQIFLIARRTPKNRPVRYARRNTKAVKEIEFALIGACLPLNRDLLNIKEVDFFRKMHVPGFYVSKRRTSSAAAGELKLMLGSKS
ncbi:MAG TPA: GIY-YIG nuclease family protein [Acidobacteriaceae bacterium]|nr:GIY-YIG nuclease family protein [Acidobacteriaceae bacterium]